MRILFGIGGFLAGAIVIFATILIAHGAGYLIVFPKGEDQIELATLFLAAATLVITAVAMLLAIAAVVGYTALREAAADAGGTAGENVARELLPDLVRQEVAAALASLQGRDRTEEIAEALAAPGGDDGRHPEN